jgi:CRP-like cAMP-binding protein
MITNSVYSAHLGQSPNPSSALPTAVWRKHAHERGSDDEVRDRSKKNVGRSPSIRTVNALARSPLFTRLNNEELARLNARCHWREIRAGELLRDDSADGYALSVVTNGRVRAVRIVNGREIILGDMNEGEFFGELSAIDGKPAPAQILAITDAIIARIPSDVFRHAIYQYPSVCDKLLATFADRIRTLSDRFSEQISLSIRERLCVELLRLSRRTAKDRIVVSPPPSHFELAARIGACRETVTKLLIGFERDGLISRNRVAIALTDILRLEAIAERSRQ